MTIFRRLKFATAILCLSSPVAAQALTYFVSGTFATRTDSFYATLSGGSFRGQFQVENGTFPLAAQKNLYLYDAFYTLDLFDKKGATVAQLRNTPSTDTYLQVATTHVDIYGGLRLYFRNSSTSYLQLVMPLTFDGVGAINGSSNSYALVTGDDYASIQSANVSLSPVPEPEMWAMMILGLSAVGAIRRRGARSVHQQLIS